MSIDERIKLLMKGSTKETLAYLLALRIQDDLDKANED